MKKLSARSSFVLTTLFAVSLGICASLYNVPVQAKPNATTPTSVQGRWVAASTSATNYWSRDTGQYLGNGSGSGQVYDFDSRGNFKYYMLMEVRTGSFVTRVRTNYSGTVSFSGSKFTLHPTAGHYHTETGSRISERDMAANDLARMTKTYDWRLEKGYDGKPNFIIPFSDGSKHVFTPLSTK